MGYSSNNITYRVHNKRTMAIMDSINVKVDDHLPRSYCSRSEESPIIPTPSGFSLGGSQAFRVPKDVLTLDYAKSASVPKDIRTSLGTEYPVLEDVRIEARTDQHLNDQISGEQLKQLRS